MLEWLPWQDAAGMAGATSAAWAGTRRSARAWARAVRPWAKELTFILVLYAMWQYAGAWSLGRASAAVARGRTIWDLERWLHLPSERTTQALVLQHRSLLHWLNMYYAWVHVPALGVCLVWLFVRHRNQYPQVRTVVALVTGAGLVIQLFPVAPPRLLPRLGIVDTGAVIGPSVYSRGAPGLDQLSAMPSLHVAWALIVGGSIVWVCRSRWRWLALGYPALTVFTVVVTGNHFWADGIVAAALCAVAAFIVARAYRKPMPPGPTEDPVPFRPVNAGHPVRAGACSPASAAIERYRWCQMPGGRRVALRRDRSRAPAPRALTPLACGAAGGGCTSARMG
jgi:PAP2 superfamily